MLDYPMSEERRNLFLKVWAGHYPHDKVAIRLHYLDCHFPPNKLLFALHWLIRNQITGSRFVAWVENECKASNLEMHRELLKRVEQEKSTRRIMAGRDFKT